jgi:hypothetical protein
VDIDPDFQPADIASHIEQSLFSSVTSHVTLVHLRVMPGGYIFARIIGITAKDVVALDLLWRKKLHSLVVL